MSTQEPTREEILKAERDEAMDLVAQQRVSIRQLTSQCTHWKDNHDNQVKIKAALLDRPDLKDRAPRVVALGVENEILKRDVAILQQEVNKYKTRPLPYRASGDTICPSCEKPYAEHPYSEDRDHLGEPYLNILCSGELVKL